jgi:multidrug efflux pump
MGFNLSAWALRNRQIVLFLMLLLAVVGALSYTKLGQSEDPPFTFKAMVIRTLWPGATAEEVSRQVTERIEKKLMETGEYERIVSFSRPGESQVTFMARDSMHSSHIPTCGIRCAKRSATFAIPCRRTCRGRFSTMNSAPPSAIFTA